MKRLMMLMAFAGLVTACHNYDYQGGTTAGSYQGTQGEPEKTGAVGIGGQPSGETYQGAPATEYWSGSMTNTNTVIVPQEPGAPSDPGKTGASDY